MASFNVGRGFRLFFYFVVITLSITSFALIVHDLKDVFGTGVCTIVDVKSSSLCNFGIAANCIVLAFAFFAFVWVVAVSVFSALDRALVPMELALTGFNTIWSMIWAIVISAKASKQRPEKANAVLGFSWVDFGLLVICTVLLLTTERGEKEVSEEGGAVGGGGDEAETAQA